MGNSQKGKKKTDKRDEAVLGIKLQRDKLTRFQRMLDGNIEKLKKSAMDLIKQGKKERALLLLRKKKMQEVTLDRSMKQINNLHEMISSLEFQEIQVKVFKGLKEGTAALKMLQKEMTIEDIQLLMEETREAVDKQNELNEALSEMLTEEDDEEANSELAEIMAELAAEKIETVEVPSEKLPEIKQEIVAEKVEEKKVEENVEEEGELVSMD